MSSPSLPQPPSPFPPIHPFILEAGRELHRNHSRDFGAAQFNPCRGQPTRFAPFAETSDACVPTLYAATDRAAAAFESIFHDIEPTAPFKTVRLDVVEARSVSRVAPQRDLRLASLFTPDLHAWGLRRTDLIDTPKSAYGQTVLWAQAIHRDHADVDGLIWTSRQYDQQQAMVLFGDRVSEADFEVMERLEVAGDVALLLELRGYGRRAGIDIVS